MRKPTLQFLSASLLVIGGALFAASAHAGKTLDAIKARDQVVCGVNTGLAGFSAADSQGNWVGLDVDICKAIAARAVREFRSEGKWIKAAQHFFGKLGPWKAYYQAEVTNRAIEPTPDPPPRPRPPESGGDLGPLGEAAS